MRLNEITKDEFHKRLVDPVKVEFLKRFESYKEEVKKAGFVVELHDMTPFTIVNTYIGEAFMPIGHITRYLNDMAKVYMFNPEFTQKNNIKWQQGSDGMIKLVWEVKLGEQE